jgi:transcription elongation factor Elf1
LRTLDTDMMLAKTLNLKLARTVRDNDRTTNNSDSGGGDNWWLSPKKKLECPGCGGINFTISRGIMVEGDRYPTEIAYCLKCGDITAAFALKTKYNGSDDFLPVNFTSMIFKFRCGECNQLHESRIYESIVYAYTTYSNMEPIPKWHCPKHPRAKVKKTWTPMVDSCKRETNDDGTDLELPIPDKWGP